MSEENGRHVCGDEHEAAWQELHGGRLALPPSDDRLEMRLLGMMLISDVAPPKGLFPREFVDPVHGAIFDAVRRCAAASEPVNPSTVAAQLTTELEEVGGAAYLDQLASAACDPKPPFVQVESAAETISELAHARYLLTCLAALRRLIHAHEELLHEPGSHGPGAGRSKAHWLAMDLTGLARDVLDRSLGWA